MKTKLVLSIIVMCSANFAHANGWQCTFDHYNVNAYNQTQAAKGTRNAAIMIVSDASQPAGSKTQAKFTSDSSIKKQAWNPAQGFAGTLSSTTQAPPKNARAVVSVAKYTGAVDDRYQQTKTSNQIEGMALYTIATVELAVQSPYKELWSTTTDNAQHAATLNITDRSGNPHAYNGSCTYYLKNQ